MLLLIFSRPPATNWYIDKDAAGSNNGTSWANAWTAFSSVNWASINPGDTVYISGGSTSKTYANMSMTVGASGTSGSPITITKGVDASHDGEVIIDGQGTAAWLVDASNDNYITIQNLTIKNGVNACVAIWNGTGCILQDCNLEPGPGANASGNARGLDVRNTTDTIVRRNTIVSSSTATTDQVDGIYSTNNTNYLYEDNDVIINNTDNTGHSDAFQSHLDLTGTVRNNRFISPTAGSNNHVAFIHAVDTGDTMDFYNNICISRGGQTNTTYWRDGDGQVNGSVNFYNNTIWGGSRGINLERVANVVLRNNLIVPDSNGTGVYVNLTDPATANITYNLVWVPSGVVARTNANGNRTWSQWTSTDGYNANGLNDYPYFVNGGSFDFRLLPTSTAINAGTTIGIVTTDYDGTSRPQGAAYEMGAYEFISGVSQVRYFALLGAA